MDVSLNLSPPNSIITPGALPSSAFHPGFRYQLEYIFSLELNVTLLVHISIDQVLNTAEKFKKQG